MIISSIVAVVRQELVVHDIHEFMLSAWSMRVIFGEGSSLIGPCQPVFEVMISMLMAMYWSLKRFSFRKLSVCGVLAICLIFSIRSHYTLAESMARQSPGRASRFSTQQSVQPSIAISWFVTLKGIPCERCGDNIGNTLEKRVEEVTRRVSKRFSVTNMSKCVPR